MKNALPATPVKYDGRGTRFHKRGFPVARPQKIKIGNNNPIMIAIAYPIRSVRAGAAARVIDAEAVEVEPERD